MFVQGFKGPASIFSLPQMINKHLYLPDIFMVLKHLSQSMF